MHMDHTLSLVAVPVAAVEMVEMVTVAVTAVDVEMVVVRMQARFHIQLDIRCCMPYQSTILRS